MAVAVVAIEVDFDAEGHGVALAVVGDGGGARQTVDAHVFRVEANDGDGIVVVVDDDDGCEDAVVAEVPPAGRNNVDAAGADADELPAIILALALWPLDQFSVRPE
jgi:hypothetical protein